jgi:FMN phosphatase YigB (HAD superfamily)
MITNFVLGEMIMIKAVLFDFDGVLTIDVLDISASECLFIDNTEKNLIIPRKMGMATIFYDDDNRDYDLFLNDLETIILKLS